MKKFAIMMMGKTHSGKTTFGENIVKEINGVVLQTDPINIFLKKEFPADLDRDKERDGSFRKSSLKVKIYETIFDHILKTEKFIPVLANSNMFLKMRIKTIQKLKKHDYNVIGVFLNFSEEFLLKRVKIAKKSTDVLNVSKDFKVLLKKQRKIFVIPKKEEFDYFFEATDEKEVEVIKQKIIDLVR